jgi:hypothetical protein
LTEHAPDDEYGEDDDCGDLDYGEDGSPGHLDEVSVAVHENEASPDNGKENAEEETIVVKKKTKPIINVYCTEYDVVKKVAKKVNNFKLVEIEEDHEGGIHKGVGGGKLSTVWDITWHDLAITPDFLAKLEPYQKVS